MTIKTHALLAALTTAAVIGFIYYRSSGDENARMRKVIAQAEAAAQAKNEAETAKAAAKEKAAKPAVPEEEKPVESEQPKKPVNAKAEQPPAKPQVTTTFPRLCTRKKQQKTALFIKMHNSEFPRKVHRNK